MKDNYKLKSLELYSEIVNDMGDVEYFLKAVYEYKDKYKKSELVVPKIHLRVNHYNPIINIPCASIDMMVEGYIDLGFGDLPMIPVNKALCTERILEEYPQKMTMEELEKKLGHKVEIVSKK